MNASRLASIGLKMKTFDHCRTVEHLEHVPFLYLSRAKYYHETLIQFDIFFISLSHS